MGLLMHDARKLDRATREELRRIAISRITAGEQQAAVARSLRVNRTTVVRWMMAYRRGGLAALKIAKGGGRPAKLTAKQQDQLRGIIIGKNPSQLGFGMALWTIPIVAQVIEKRFNVVLHETNVSRLLRRLGLTPQKPVRRAFQRNDLECVRWMRDEFPSVVRRAKRKQATLMFSDETGVHEDAPVGTTWAQKGTRPEVRVKGSRRRINVISAISPRGRLWFRCFQGTLTAPRFVAFLQALVRDVRGYIILVVDRHPAHRAAATRRWLAEHRSRIELHFLPGYAPDLNPDEHVWGYLKGLFRRDPLEADEKIDDAVEGAMSEIAADKELVRGFFGHPAVKYVRDALHW